MSSPAAGASAPNFEDPYPPTIPPLSALQKSVLVSACDAVFAPLSSAETEGLVKELARDEAHAKAIRTFCGMKASDVGLEVAEDLLARTLTKEEAATLTDACDKLSTRIFTLALAWQGATPFADLPVQVRQRVISEWIRSRVELIRRLGHALKRVGMLLMVCSDINDSNPLFEAIRYPGPKGIREQLLALPLSHDMSDLLREARLQPAGSDALRLECDCVIVGSGVGGSVMALQVARAGYKVIMLEKGGIQENGSLVTSEPGVYSKTLERGGLAFSTEDGVFTIAAGSALGGGTAVNWFCSLDPPHFVRSEWASQFGLDWAAGDRLSAALESVKSTFGVHVDGIEHNPANTALLRGCKRMGYHAEVAPQQGYPACPGDGGLCGWGYKGGERQGTKGSFLKDAAATGKFHYLTRAFANKVVVKGGRAEGIVGEFQGRPLEIRARTVVCSGGSLQTPLLLRRSGLKNPHIGKNLRLHPVSMIHGLFPETMELWKGAPMTTVSRVAENLDGKGYGVKLEIPHAHPLVIASTLPYRGDPVEYKRLALQLDRSMLILALARDTGSGQVVEDERHWPRVTYRVNNTDKKHICEGLCYAAKIMVAAGATELRWGDPDLPTYKATPLGAGDPGLDAWCAKLRALGLPAGKTGLFCAHQMGSCRLAASPQLGAARPSGETWEVKDLFIADASTFPTASGSNPMITTAAVAHVVAENVVARLGAPNGSAKL